MVYEANGKIYEIGKTVDVSEKFCKREFVLHVPNEKNDKYDDYVKFEVVQDNCDKLDDVKVGDDVCVKFVVSGRKYEKDGTIKFFTSLKALNIIAQNQNDEFVGNVVEKKDTNKKEINKPEPSDDGLPF